LAIGVKAMEIKKNEKLREYGIEMSQLKDHYSKEYHTITSYFWPMIAQNKKRLKDQIYYTGAMICLLVFIVVVILLGGLKNEYLLWGSLIFCFILIGIGVVITTRTIKKQKMTMEEWEKNNKKIQEIQEKIQETTIKAVIEIPYVIFYSEHYEEIVMGKLKENSGEWHKLIEQEKQKMLENTAGSMAYDDVIGYYNHWADNF
jgi:hypothetical protein